MKDEDKKNFAVAMRAIFELWSKEVTTTKLRMYWVALSDLTIDEFAVGVQRALSECRFIPSPAEIRELSGRLTSEDRCVSAWGDAIHAVATCGVYRSVAFRDQAINAVIRNCGGWVVFCSRLSDDGEEKWLKQEFMRAYISISRRAMGEEECQPLYGLSGKEPILVGEHRAAIESPRMSLAHLISDKPVLKAIEDGR